MSLSPTRLEGGQLKIRACVILIPAKSWCMSGWVDGWVGFFSVKPSFHHPGCPLRERADPMKGSRSRTAPPPNGWTTWVRTFHISEFRSPHLKDGEGLRKQTDVRTNSGPQSRHKHYFKLKTFEIQQMQRKASLVLPLPG